MSRMGFDPLFRFATSYERILREADSDASYLADD